ncbi:hypothetical protein NBH00_19655 [Paraconexibacter antarcticus]|uniref:Uncharacterized protein n=1 Tax=Paraconexibacter antarcticus TaxID=2949664 RepID=A0ABY5DNE5_9ACTN|nr:hypothetical protein [Paraconexibacter antarcticus]UTI63546.1 hypothetical protein NBH00_19655 [Paraconexibacter antarcticus]
MHALREERRELAAALHRAEDRAIALGPTHPLAEARAVAAVKGEPRRLTPAELEDLRATGPAGPAVMAKALGDLAAARRCGNPTALREALSRVARAAVTWQERL